MLTFCCKNTRKEKHRHASVLKKKEFKKLIHPGDILNIRMQSLNISEGKSVIEWLAVLNKFSVIYMHTYIKHMHIFM